ncbi:prevent-host-death protein [Rhizobium anhuiense bv. trifolii]|jgi:PHD/YefM family antitoxin component YafN of YafNO toxin-antitoxin module|nr:type II toxin-antitoxin system Phd/YefM family antitoxin [Rhizobium anhuiense]KZS50484.1 prevent-host-death protein [Rhizobium anhuiense bv. trifolii]
MKLSEQLKPISDLKAHEPTILRTLKDHSQPVVITLHGEAKAVLQDDGQYEEHRRRWRILKMLAHQPAGRGGQLRPAAESFARICKRLADSQS